MVSDSKSHTRKGIIIKQNKHLPIKKVQGVQVGFKGIEATVTPAEIIAALKVKNFSVNTAINILSKDKVPQTLFKI